ncbi:hypothetical protein AB1E18_013893 [Capra hircus]
MGSVVRSPESRRPTAKRDVPVLSRPVTRPAAAPSPAQTPGLLPRVRFLVRARGLRSRKMAQTHKALPMLRRGWTGPAVSSGKRSLRSSRLAPRSQAAVREPASGRGSRVGIGRTAGTQEEPRAPARSVARTPSPAVGVPPAPARSPTCGARTDAATARAPHSPAAARGQRFWTPRRGERGAPAQFTPALRSGRTRRRGDGSAGLTAGPGRVGSGTEGRGCERAAETTRADEAGGRGARARRSRHAPRRPGPGAGLQLPAAPAAGAGCPPGRRGPFVRPPLAARSSPCPGRGPPGRRARRGEASRGARGRAGLPAGGRLRASGRAGAGARVCVPVCGQSERVTACEPGLAVCDSA